MRWTVGGLSCFPVVLPEGARLTFPVKAFVGWQVLSLLVNAPSAVPYVIVILRALGMYGIYCTEARGREAARGLSVIASRVRVI